MAETNARTVRIAGRVLELRRARIERAMRGVLPNPVKTHFVVVGGRRYPPKQVVGRVTGLDAADFTTHQARRILVGLGFPAGRRPDRDPAKPRSARAAGGHLAEALGEHVGEWVAVADGEVLIAATTPDEVVEWLARHRRRADSMFRVPEDETAASGLAPL